MKKTTIFTVIYIIMVIIDGLMSYIYYNKLSELYFALIGGLALIISLYFYEKKRKYFIFIIPVIGIILNIFYGYNFSKTHSFYPGLLTAISAFLVGSYIIEIINYYGRDSKQ